MENTSPWKKPDEVMQMHRLRKRKRALKERMKHPIENGITVSSNVMDSADLNFSRILNGDKRKNPFYKEVLQEIKKVKKDGENLQLDESSDKTLFALLNLSSTKMDKPIKDLNTDKLSTFSNLLQKYTAEHSVEQIPETKYKYLPIDWALNMKLRLMSPKPFAWNQTLKASEEASGITGFVRCLDTTSSITLDTSPQACFHQMSLYWQHPHLPWLTLYPRSTGRVAATGFLASNEEVTASLHREWTESFRSLFQLLRARHCPYFYVCANTFTCLFRAAGVCGVSEPCALLAPTTRGFRQALRQEDVDFTMPLRPESKRKSNNSESKDDEKPKNSSFDSCYDTMDETKPLNESKITKHDDIGNISGDEDDIDSDKFLSQLGFEAEEIKKINHSDVRVQQTAESVVDSAAESLVFVRGADAQALFNFLLNCKSIISPVGPFAGVPPTLLSPTAFNGGTLQSLKVRKSVVLSDNNKYYSIELRGPILPTTLHSLFQVLRTSSAAQFSATLAHHQPTLAFSWASKAILEEYTKENGSNHFSNAFNKENLSDCGISDDLLKQLCSADPALIKSVDSIKYNCDDDSYSW